MEGATMDAMKPFSALWRAMILGPVLASATPFAIFYVALSELDNLLRDRPQGINIGEEALMVIILTPIAALSAYPLALGWLRRPWGGYWGALCNGAFLGAVWTVIGTVLARVYTGTRVGTAIGNPNLEDLVVHCTLIGIPLGMAHAAAFWIFLQRLEAAQHGEPGPTMKAIGIMVLAYLALAWGQFGIFAGIGAVLG